MVANAPAAGNPAPARTRRTQQRAIETRRLLLDTAIEVLLDVGYAGFSTVAVGERAGVSRGTQVHHFRTKTELVVAAMNHLAAGYQADISGRWRRTPLRGDRVNAALDALWSAHTRPLLLVSFEVIIGARADPELISELVEFERSITGMLLEGGRLAFGPYAERPGFTDALLTTLSAMRGLAMTRSIYPGTDRQFAAIWRKNREQLRLLFLESSDHKQSDMTV